MDFGFNCDDWDGEIEGAHWAYEPALNEGDEYDDDCEDEDNEDDSAEEFYVLWNIGIKSVDPSLPIVVRHETEAPDSLRIAGPFFYEEAICQIDWLACCFFGNPKYTRS